MIMKYKKHAHAMNAMYVELDRTNKAHNEVETRQPSIHIRL